MRPGYLAPEFAQLRKDTCYLCPQPGTNCSEPGVTITTLELAPGYWRSGNTSVAVLPCPDEHRGEDSACGGGTAACREESGVSGVFCTLCPDDMYKQYETSSCVSCDNVTYSLAVPLLLAVVLLIASGLCFAHAASSASKEAVKKLQRWSKRALFGHGYDVDLKLLWRARARAA